MSTTSQDSNKNTKLYSSPSSQGTGNHNHVVRQEFDVAQEHARIPVVNYNYRAKNIVQKPKTIVNKLLYSEGSRVGVKSHFDNSLPPPEHAPATYYHGLAKHKASGETKDSELERDEATQNGLMYIGVFFIMAGVAMYAIMD